MDTLKAPKSGLWPFLLSISFLSFLHGQTPGKKPNLIFLVTDDHRWDALGFAGNALIRTPEMDRLAAEGVYFRNAFSSSPICAASRASILTGQYERSHGYTFRQPPLSDALARTMYPAILKENGYRVGFFGKLGVEMANPGQYFHEFDSYDRGNYPDRRGYFYKKIGQDTVHLTHFSGYQARQFLRETGENQPFCLSVFFSAPHGHDPSTQQYFWEKASDPFYRDLRFPEPLLGDSMYFHRLPEAVKTGFNRTRWYWRFDTPEKYQEMLRGYYRMITDIDREIGQLRKTLEETGLAENTIIILMGDNGYFTGDRQLADKWLMYEPAIRIPLIFFDPRSRGGFQVEDMVLNLDIPGTILDLAGLQIPANYQGKSLKPLVNNRRRHLKRKEILIEHLWRFDEIPASEGIRTKHWKYFRYRHIQAPEELYHLAVDPLETSNLALVARYGKKLMRLRTRFDRLARNQR